MNKGKKKKRVLNDEEKCEIMSNSISRMIDNSENPDFVNDCHRILEAENKDQMKNKLKNKFFKAMTKKKSESSSSCNSQELDDSLNDFLESTENIFSCGDELKGFADWDKF